MASFAVHGPIEIPYEKRKGGRILQFDGFWTLPDASGVALRQGCYVFAIRNRALTPIYIGKATRSFQQEVFNPSNRHKYHNGFSEYAKGTPLLFFVILAKKRGRRNTQQISEVEDFLIQTAIAKNPRLQNVRGTQQPDWSITGVVRSSAGRMSQAASEFRRLFDIQSG